MDNISKLECNLISQVRYSSFPRTRPSPTFVKSIVEVIKLHEAEISTIQLRKGLESNQVLNILRDGLLNLGFSVEMGKVGDKKLH